MCARSIILQVDIDQGWARTGPELLSGQDHVLCPERTVGVGYLCTTTCHCANE